MKIPVFPNLGNTCYLNSVLQCLVYNPALKNIDPSGNEFITELNKITGVVDTSENGENIAVLYSLKDIIKLLPFKRFEQQDAHECIMIILDSIISFIKPEYYGETRTNIHCSGCDNLTSIYEDFNCINLSVDTEASTVTELLLKYFEHETISNYCEHCKALNSYEKKVSLNRLPKNLIIVLKRYTFTGTKLLTKIDIEDVLKIRESATDEVKTYTLSSTINHSGNLYSGHYTNFVFINGRWMYIDDHLVKVENLNSEDVYILFYNNVTFNDL